ncbi:hypothetical protein Leryth_022565 [Lithospermum erythrorhizon]|nr:hypothetical protein Leryth_022565 [Lithospermum erythrorhizon]
MEVVLELDRNRKEISEENGTHGRVFQEERRVEEASDAVESAPTCLTRTRSTHPLILTHLLINSNINRFNPKMST